MCPQFGYWSPEGHPLDLTHREHVHTTLKHRGLDSVGNKCGPGFEIVCHTVCTVPESLVTAQPYVTASGHVLVWEGRLDNGPDLIRSLRNGARSELSDLGIVVACYEQWGTGCFSKLIGDWALSIWNPSDRVLLLGKDFLGLRPLYYRRKGSDVLWSSSLEALLFEKESLSLSEEYFTALLFTFPPAYLTPYREVRSVSPASFIRITVNSVSSHAYWAFDKNSILRYKDDAQYEEHFREVFAEAVRRRLRSRTPVLAELSGGMDSSSIVCLADNLLTMGKAAAPRLDTISYFDNSEPDWNELPYITLVETQRGRTGIHVDVSQTATGLPECGDAFPVTPAALASLPETSIDFGEHRVVLSGIGGDEALGGVVTPIPELADLIVDLRIKRFAQQSVAWALRLKRPLLPLIMQAARFALPAIQAPDECPSPPEWITKHLYTRYRQSLRGDRLDLGCFGLRPSLVANLHAIESLRRQIAYLAPIETFPPVEKRYPYLDRDLWEFVCAIPREQILRPGQRRSLMRRSLVEIVPKDILNRPRKAFVIRGPMNAITIHWDELTQLLTCMRSATLGMVEPKIFQSALEKARTGQAVAIVSIHRTITVERWLRRVLDGDNPWGIALSPWTGREAHSAFTRKPTAREVQQPCIHC
jgi:asparagine synthase (glutamine-hydrolysing)